MVAERWHPYAEVVAAVQRRVVASRWTRQTDLWDPRPSWVERSGRRRTAPSERRPKPTVNYARVGLDADGRIVLSERYQGGEPDSSCQLVDYAADGAAFAAFEYGELFYHGRVWSEDGRSRRSCAWRDNGEEAEERYEYDDNGRLVEVQTRIWAPPQDGDRALISSGRSRLTYDAGGALAEIVHFYDDPDLSPRTLSVARRGRATGGPAVEQALGAEVRRWLGGRETTFAAVAFQYATEQHPWLMVTALYRATLDRWGLTVEALNPAEWTVPDEAEELRPAGPELQASWTKLADTASAAQVRQVLDRAALALSSDLGDAGVLVYPSDVTGEHLEGHLSRCLPAATARALGLAPGEEDG